MAFSLTLQNQTSFEILDIEFFDEVEVALLLKLPIEGSRRAYHFYVSNCVLRRFAFE